MNNLLRECAKINDKLMADPTAVDFLAPVPWQDHEYLYDYPKIIKEPMDLGTIKSKS